MKYPSLASSLSAIVPRRDYDQRVAAEIAAAVVNGEWNWSYTKWIGNGDIKGELTAALKVKDTPDIYQLTAKQLLTPGLGNIRSWKASC